MPDPVDEIIIRDVRPDGVTYPWWWFGGKGADPDEEDLSDDRAQEGDAGAGGSGAAAGALPVVTVVGRRLPRRYVPPNRFPGWDRFVDDLGGRGYTRRPPPTTTPPAVPPPVPNVVVTAKRPPPARPNFLGRGNAAIGIAGFIAEYLNQISENALQAAGFAATRPVYTQRSKDTPVQTIQPTPIDEIIVTAQTGDYRSIWPQIEAEPYQYGRVDLGYDLYAEPLFLNNPQLQPKAKPGRPNIRPPRPPRRPQRRERRRRIPQRRPERRPDLRPGFRPTFRPGTPKVTPQTRKGTPPSPLFGVGTVEVPRTIEFPRVGQDPQPETDKKCKPCKKKKDEPREKCYKKLVKEAVYPKDDTAYNWTEIDCITGREL